MLVAYCPSSRFRRPWMIPNVSPYISWASMIVLVDTIDYVVGDVAAIGTAAPGPSLARFSAR